MLILTAYISKCKYILYTSCDLAQDKPRHKDGEKNQGGIKMVSITKLEKQIIEALEYNDFANESAPGLHGYIFHDEWNMTVFRGVMSSLSKKGIVSWSEAEYVNDDPRNGCNWGYIKSEFTIIENEIARMNWELFEGGV